MMLPGPGQGPELAPLLRPARPPPRRRAAWLTASALLHALLLVAVLLAARRMAPGSEEGGAPSVEMVFEPPATPASPAPAGAPQQEDVPTPGQTEFTPTAPPDETATQPGAEPSTPTPAPPPAPEPTPQSATPVAPPQPVAPPVPAAPVPPGPVLEPAPAPPQPAPPEPAPAQRAPPQTAAPPAVRLYKPDVELLPPPVPVPEAPPLPPVPARAPPRPAVQARPAPNPFAGALMLGGPLALQQPPGRPARRGGAPSRALDLSLGPVSAEPVVSGRYAAAHAANREKDWGSLFRTWFEQHKYYPAEAAIRGEDGSSTVEITVDRNGRVAAASLVETSGSPRLDAALLGTLRGANVPPLLPGMATPFTTTITLHYVLIR